MHAPNFLWYYGTLPRGGKISVGLHVSMVFIAAVFRIKFYHFDGFIVDVRTAEYAVANLVLYL